MDMCSRYVRVIDVQEPIKLANRLHLSICIYAYITHICILRVLGMQEPIKRRICANDTHVCG